jgi:folate-binding protein YgfZ
MNFSRALAIHILKQNCIKNNIRYISRQTNTKNLVHLEQRALLRLTSNDVLPFLQGLTTNDMKHFEKGAVSIYSVLLNIKGRVLYDIIIYKVREKEIFYIECDRAMILNLIKHLKMYKLRKTINIQTMENNMKVWSLYDTNVIYQNYCDLQNNNKLKEKKCPYEINNKLSNLVDNINVYNDPRIFELGLRILTGSNIKHSEIIKHLGPNILIEKNISNYIAFRYKLGVGEGVKDLSFGVSLPLEINCDYLNGVNFQKGCYIGQELTARTHHTGVVRKRLMPLILKNMNSVNLKYDDKIINEDGKVVGKIRGQEGTVGLGLMRISEALASKTLFVRDCSLKIVRPQWWPQEFQIVKVLTNNKN